MTEHNPAVWTLHASDGELIVHTGVTGRAAKMGHRLTIVIRQWQATVTWAGDGPAAAELAVDVSSLDVVRGEGGVTPLSGAEKSLVRSNALRSLDADRYPEITFTAEDIEKSTDGYRLTGPLRIHGKTRKQVIDLGTTDLGDTWRMSAQAAVRQSDFGVKPYSLFMGSLKVADKVSVSFTAQHTKH